MTQRNVAHAILGFLHDHPRAQDTLEGICEWWLSEQEIRNVVAAAQAALSSLVEKELVIVRRGADGRLRYLLNQDRREEVAAILTEAAEETLS